MKSEYVHQLVIELFERKVLDLSRLSEAIQWLFDIAMRSAAAGESVERRLIAV